MIAIQEDSDSFDINKLELTEIPVVNLEEDGFETQYSIPHIKDTQNQGSQEQGT